MPARATYNLRLRQPAMMLIWFTIMLAALMAFVSLGVDLGRVQLAKTELQRAADAAARYGASGIDQGSTTVASRAITAAADNTADGQSIVLQNADVQVGMWNSTSKTFTSGGTPNNAVRVTVRRTASRGNAIPLLFAKVLGLTSCDVTATSIALASSSGGPATGFVGLSRFEAGNNSFVRSYDPAAGTPGGANLFTSGSVKSNTYIDFGNGTDIYGSVSIGSSGSVSLGNHVTISGGTTTLSSTLSYSNTESPGVSSTGSISVGNNQNVSLSAGTYNYSRISTGNNCTIQFTGPATVYVTGYVDMGNNCEIYAYGNNPRNLQIRVVGSGSVNFGNSPDIYAQIYCPQSQFHMGNNSILWGSVVASQFEVGNSADLYDDQSQQGAASSSGSASIALVQ